MRRADLFWIAAFVLLLLLGYGLVPTPSAREPIDSFSADSAGKKAFYLLAESLLGKVSRSSGSLIPPDPSADTLVMLGPSRYPDRAQWQTLYDWVSEGRALVFAARWRDPAVRLEPFGIEVVPKLGFLSSDDDEEEEVPPGEPGEDDEDAEPWLQTDLVDGPFRWETAGEIRTDATDVSVELSEGGAPQVVWRPIGDGAIIVVASDYVFTNRAMTDPALGLLAFRILETAAPSGPVYFDEEMNALGAPRVVGILFEEPFRLLTLQLLIVVFLFGWAASRRFGPVSTTMTSTRRSLVEHAEALGALHFKVGSGPRLIAAYLEFFRSELGLRSSAHGRLERDPTRELGDAADRADLDAAIRESRGAPVSRAHVSERVRFLARFRQES